MHTERDVSQVIQQLYCRLNTQEKTDLSSRIGWWSKQLLGKPYQLGALGEGSLGHFDQFPLFRLDAFDCETFVDTVLALSLAHNVKEFKHLIRQIRYQDGEVSFLKRNHFTCLDWNKNNQHQGITQDITRDFHTKGHHPVAETAAALINKPAWYQSLPLNTIRLYTADTNEQKKRLHKLKQQGKKLAPTLSLIPYIPLTRLFDAAGKPNLYLFNQIPHTAIIEIIRPNWDLRQTNGTALNVSHLGFAIWENQHLQFRQASSEYGRTVDVSLIDYLRNAMQSPTIKGINVQIVRDPRAYHP